MDGHFVPNITMGAPILEHVYKNVPNIFMDCHMMVSNPSQWVPEVAKAGGKLYTFHYEATGTSLYILFVCTISLETYLTCKKQRSPKKSLSLSIPTTCLLALLFHLKPQLAPSPTLSVRLPISCSS